MLSAAKVAELQVSRQEAERLEQEREDATKAKKKAAKLEAKKAAGVPPQKRKDAQEKLKAM